MTDAARNALIAAAALSLGAMTFSAAFAMEGGTLAGRSAGALKTTTLIPLERTSTGVTIAHAVGARICEGDSGSPVVAEGRRGPVLWGVAAAVVTSEPPCGEIVIIAPATPDFSG